MDVFLEILICFGILCLFVVYPSLRGAATVGLPLCYILNLAVIHWFGGLIHALPWHSNSDPYTEVGFAQAFWATVAFTIGALVLAPFFLRVLSRGGTSLVVRNPGPDQLRLPKIYLLVGVVSFLILFRALSSIPSLSALGYFAMYLAVVGVCLECWSAYIQRSNVRLALWLISISLLPLVTIVTWGFAGYGAMAALMVFTFVASYYQPRWQGTVGLALLILFGLSLFVTYFRDRPRIRQKVWGGAVLSDRIDTLASTLANFEVLDLQNPRHLAAIDSRMNQNYFVGRAVRTIELGQEQFAHGRELYEALLALVPRIVWPDKPVRAGSGNTVSRYTRMRLSPTTSFGIGHVLEFYINFGTVGVLAGFLILGIVIRVMDTQAALSLYEGNWQAFMTWFLPSMSLLSVQGSLVELFGGLGASVVLVVIVNRLLAIGVVNPRKTKTAVLAKSS